MITFENIFSIYTHNHVVVVLCPPWSTGGQQVWRCDAQNMYFVAFVLEGERSGLPQECDRQVERQSVEVRCPKPVLYQKVKKAAYLKSKARQRTESVEMQWPSRILSSQSTRAWKCCLPQECTRQVDWECEDVMHKTYFVLEGERCCLPQEGSQASRQRGETANKAHASFRLRVGQSTGKDAVGPFLFTCTKQKTWSALFVLCWRMVIQVIVFKWWLDKY